MGIASNIIDALRSIGTPTQKSAIARQDRHFEGKEVIERSRETLRDPSGTTKPFAEAVHVLTVDEVRPLQESSAFGLEFLKTFGGSGGPDWTLEELDNAFATWPNASDRCGYTDEVAIELLGAMFGQYCNSQLNMRWIKLTDQDGSTLAVDGVLKQLRGFPYQTISKRIAASEHGFFRPVFLLLRHNESEALQRPDATTIT